ncbi:MAG TPA: hypothetical protein V6D05_17470 [Stenomitos sp.]
MRFISLLLSAALLASSLAGCGRDPLPTARIATEAALQADNAKADKLAHDFAVGMRRRSDVYVTEDGPVVTLHYQLMASTLYDFSKTPKKGLVHVSSKDFEIDLSLDKVMQSIQVDVLPALVVPIAIEVAIGAAKGLSIYWLTHRGEKFDKQEAIKATAVGMLASLIPFVGNVPLLNDLLPLAVNILAASKTLAYKDIAQAALNMVDDIVIVLSNLHWPRKH